METSANTLQGREPGGYREILNVAYPLMLSMGSFTLMQFIDRMFLAWHSPVSIQAAVPAGILAFTFICGFMSLAGYTNTFVAQHFGAGDPRGCARSTAQGVFIALGSWPLMLACIPLGRLVLRWSGHAPEVLAEELLYFDILMWGSLGIPLGAAMSGFFTGRSKTLVTMSATMAANAVNLVLDYVWIFGKWGFPEMGIQGAAWASVVSSFVLPGILMALYFGPRLNRAFQTRTHFRWDAPLWWRMIRFGLPAGIHFALDVASFGVFVLLTGRMGEVALAASNIALSINMLTFLPLVGLSIAVTTVVGQYQGRKETIYAERAAWTTLRIGGLYMFIVGMAYILVPQFFLSFFARDGASGLDMETLFPVGRMLMIIMAVWGVVDAVNLIMAGALKGAGDTRFVMWYSLAVAWGVLVPGQFLIVFWWEAGVIAAWCWTAFYILVLSLGLFLRFRKGCWRDIDVLGAPAPVPPDHPGAEAVVVGEQGT